jgi:hypothetical protein
MDHPRPTRRHRRGGLAWLHDGSRGRIGSFTVARKAERTFRLDAGRTRLVAVVPASAHLTDAVYAAVVHASCIAATKLAELGCAEAAWVQISTSFVGTPATDTGVAPRDGFTVELHAGRTASVFVPAAHREDTVTWKAAIDLAVRELAADVPSDRWDRQAAHAEALASYLARVI